MPCPDTTEAPSGSIPAAMPHAVANALMRIGSLLALIALPGEEGAGRMIRAVDVEVTVLAGAVVDEPHGRCVGGSSRRAAVGRGMALLAEPRPRHFEHFLLIAPVWVMAVRAVFGDWHVLPEERAALFGVAAVAGLVRRARDEHLLVRRAVRVVAARALELSLAQGHVGELRDLRLLVLVTVAARRDDAGAFQVSALGVRVHHGVAVGARDVT